MNRFLKSRLLRSMIPYFILGIGLLVAHRLISELGFFTDGVSNFFRVIAPFLTGAVIAYILNLPCSAIERQIKKIDNGFVKRKSRPLSVVALFIVIILLFAVTLNIVIPAISRNIMQLVSEFPVYEQTFRDWIANLEEMDLPEFIPDINEDALVQVVLDFFQGLNTEELLGSIIAGLGGAAMAVFRTFLAVIASIYILLEKNKLKAFTAKLVAAITSSEANETVIKYAKKLNFNFHQYIYTQTIDGMILGSIMFVVLVIFRSDYALVLALILGVLNYIPYFGSIVGTAIAVLVIAFTQGLPTAGVAAIVMFIIQQLDGNVIQPKLMGGSFSLSPLLVIISVTIGGFYAGILGMLLAIPIIAILKDLLDEYIAYAEEKKRMSPNPEENDFMDRDIW